MATALKSNPVCTIDCARKWKPTGIESPEMIIEWGSRLGIMLMHQYKLAKDVRTVKKREMIECLLRHIEFP